MARAGAYVSDYLNILIVEDIAKQVKGLVTGISMHGSSASIDETASDARESLSTERWGAVLFDLGIPENAGGDSSPSVGLALIKELLAGELGDLNANVPFGILSNQGVVQEATDWFGSENFLGVFTKLGDMRDLLSVLSRRELIAADMAGIEDVRVVRRRVKLLVHSTVGDSAVLASVPSWGDDKFELPVRGLSRRLVRELRDHAPVFVYAYANIAATSPEELDPTDLHDVVDRVTDVDL